MKRLLALLVLALLLVGRPAAAQELLRDAETEAMFARMAEPLVRAAGLSPANVNIRLIHDDSINAFVVGGQTVYVHSGLIAAADRSEEHTSELQSLMRISYAVFCLKTKTSITIKTKSHNNTNKNPLK